jgi:hypothetical protein
VGEELRQPDAADREVQTFVTCRGTVSLRAAMPHSLEAGIGFLADKLKKIQIKTYQFLII